MQLREFEVHLGVFINDISPVVDFGTKQSCGLSIFKRDPFETMLRTMLMNMDHRILATNPHVRRRAIQSTKTSLIYWGNSPAKYFS